MFFPDCSLFAISTGHSHHNMEGTDGINDTVEFGSARDFQYCNSIDGCNSHLAFTTLQGDYYRGNLIRTC